jgi:putative colanic acid biosynthesis glycosyltransferase WcaE
VTNCRPTFSVITVVLNDEAGFRETMASVRSQQAAEFEWIVIDGGSRDGVPELLRTGVSRADKWLSEPDRGIYDAMQKGIALASGDMVVFMNAGDTFSSERTLAAVSAHLATNGSGAEVLFGGATLVLPNGVRRYRPPRDLHRSIWRSLPANHQATYFSRHRLLKSPYDLRFRVAGDYALIASLYRQGIKPTYLDAPLVDFRVGDYSFRHPWRLVKEGSRVQRQILGLSSARIALSAARRSFSILCLTLLATPLFGGRARK